MRVLDTKTNTRAEPSRRRQRAALLSRDWRTGAPESPPHRSAARPTAALLQQAGKAVPHA